MAIRMKKILAVALAIALCMTQMVVPVFARGPGSNSGPGGNGGNGGNNDQNGQEYYIIYIQGVEVASATGPAGSNRWLGMTYEAGATVNGTTLTWYINTNGGTNGNYGGTVDLTQYITIPEGGKVAGFNVEVLNIGGVNSQDDQYDSCIMNITISTLLDEDGNEVPIPPADPVDYEPVLSVTKAADKDVYEIGETVTWTVTVTNTSEYTAYGITVIDELVGGNWTIESLAPGASETFTATSAAAEAGSFTNVATATWTDGDEINDSDETDEVKYASGSDTVIVNEPYIPADYEPVLSVTKAADKATYKVGETVTWTITVTNTSDYIAYGITVIDELVGGNWTIESLNPGASETFTVTTKATTAGTVTNEVFVNWDDNDEIDDAEETDEVKYASAEASVAVEALKDYAPVLSVNKTADKDVYEYGETITWSITVKNTSEYTAYDITVSDETLSKNWSIESLAPGASETFTVTAEGTTAGEIRNMALVTWADRDEIPDAEELDEIKAVSDNASVTVNPYVPVDYEPVLSVTKTADKPVYEIGETITWTIIVKNDSEYTAHSVIVNDITTEDSWFIESLAPNTSKTYTVTTEATASGTVTNEVTVSWIDNDEIEDDEEDEATADAAKASVEVNEPTPEPNDYEPVLSVTKTADKDTYKIGDVVTWTITVTNDSEYTAYDITVNDEMIGKKWAIESLAPGASETFTATSTAAEVGELTNGVVINWNDNDDLDDEDENEVTTGSAEVTVEVEAPVDYEPVLTITKTADKATYQVGETVTWTITVTNDSEYTAYDITVNDALLNMIWTVESLAPGASETFTATSTAAAAGSLTNGVVVNWNDNDEIDDAEENEVTVDSAEVTVTVAQPQQPQQPQQPDAGVGLIDIVDEDVPLADVPQTGDISLLWLAMSILSGSGAIALKRKED